MAKWIRERGNFDEEVFKKTYQQEWEDRDLTYQEAREWIEIGLKEWEAGFANYLKKEGYTHTNLNNLVELRKEFRNYIKTAQNYVDIYYPSQKKGQVTKLNVSWENLGNHLNLSEFSNLEELDCGINELTFVDISNCEKLREFNCHGNQLVDLILPKGKSLRKLFLSNSQLRFIDVAYLPNLEQLYLDEDEVIEIDTFTISSESQKNKKVTEKLKQELKNYRRGKEEPLDFVYYDLSNWKQNQLGYQNLQQTLFKINPNLDIQEIINQFDFFNVKTGEFQGNLNNLTFLFSKNQENIDLLTKKLLELTNLINQQRSKIVEAYLHFAPEKELLQELITVHLTYNKTNLTKGEKDKETIKLWKQRRKIQKELEDKLEEEPSLLIKIEDALKECNKLSDAELELENKFGLGIEYNRQTGITNYYFVNINSQGNALVNCQLGDNTNLSYNNTQVGNISIQNSQFASSVAIGVGQITDVDFSTQNTEQQAQIIQLPPKSN